MASYRRKTKVENSTSLTSFQVQLLQSIPSSFWMNTISIVLKNKNFKENGRSRFYSNKEVVDNIKTLTKQGLIERR